MEASRNPCIDFAPLLHPNITGEPLADTYPDSARDSFHLDLVVQWTPQFFWSRFVKGFNSKREWKWQRDITAVRYFQIHLRRQALVDISQSPAWMAGDASPKPELNAARKRKTLEDFFVSTRSSKCIKGFSATLCHPPPSDAIPGLEIRPDFISEEEEEALLEFLEREEWRTDLARRVIHYGGTYCLMPPRAATFEERQQTQSTVLKASRMPHQLDFITARMIGQQLYTKATLPEFCIVNEYKEAQGISAHVENFRFKSPVCGLSLCQGDWMRFHELAKPDDGSVRSGKAAQAKRTGRKVDIWMPQRSLLVMSGEAREKWQHEILRSKRGRSAPGWKRVSLTFRTDKGKE